MYVDVFMRIENIGFCEYIFGSSLFCEILRFLILYKVD